MGWDVELRQGFVSGLFHLMASIFSVCILPLSAIIPTHSLLVTNPSPLILCLSPAPRPLSIAPHLLTLTWLSAPRLVILSVGPLPLSICPHPLPLSSYPRPPPISWPSASLLVLGPYPLLLFLVILSARPLPLGLHPSSSGLVLSYPSAPFHLLSLFPISISYPSAPFSPHSLLLSWPSAPFLTTLILCPSPGPLPLSISPHHVPSSCPSPPPQPTHLLRFHFLSPRPPVSLRCSNPLSSTVSGYTYGPDGPGHCSSFLRTGSSGRNRRHCHRDRQRLR